MVINPELLLADQIYFNRENRKWLKYITLESLENLWENLQKKNLMPIKEEN